MWLAKLKKILFPEKKLSAWEENRKKFKTLDIDSLIKTLWITNIPQCIGKFKDSKVKTQVFYITNSSKNLAYLPGIGSFISYVIYKDKNKYKIKWSIDEIVGTHKAYFYYR